MPFPGSQGGSLIKSGLVQRISEQNPHLYQRYIENIIIFNEIIAAITWSCAASARFR